MTIPKKESILIDGKKYVRVESKWRGPAGSWFYTFSWEEVKK